MSEQISNFHAGIRNFADVFEVIIFSTQHTFSSVSHVEFATQIAIVGIFHYRSISCGFQVEQPTSFTCFFCIHRQHINNIGWQAVQQILVGDKHAPFVGFFQRILTKIKCQHAHFFRKFTINSFVFFGQVSSVIGKTIISFFQQHLLFRRKFELSLHVVHSFYTRKKLFVQTNSI